MDDATAGTAPDTTDRLDELIGSSYPEGSDVTQKLDGPAPNTTSEPTTPEKEAISETSNDEAKPSGEGSESETSPTETQKSENKSQETDQDPDDLDSKFPDLEGPTSPKAQNKWAELRGDLKSTRNSLRDKEDRIAELELQLKTSEGSKVEPETIAKLQSQLSEKEKELSAYRVESTDLYRERVSVPLAKIAEEAEKIGGESLVSALSEPDPRKRSEALSNAVEDLNEYDRTTVFQMARELDGVIDQQSKLRSNAAEAMKELEQQKALQQTQAQIEQQKEYSSAAKDAWGVFEKKLPFMKGSDGDLREEFKEVMKEGLNTNLVEKSSMIQAYSSFSGLLLPKLLKEVSSLRSENSALSETISELESSTPGGSGGSGGSTEDSLADDGDGGFGDSLEARLASGDITWT